MRKRILYGLTLPLTALAMLSGCSDDVVTDGSAMGKISPLVALDTEAELARPQSRAGAAIEASDLELALVSATGKEYGPFSVSDFADKKFPVGSYTMTASYGDVTDEGFDKPSYYGETDLTVEENKTTNVSLTAGLANTMVSIHPTDAFKGYFDSYSFQTRSEGGSAIDVAAGVEDAVYLRPGNVTITANVTKPNGKSANLEVANFAARARCHYSVNVSVNGDNVGAAAMVITFTDALDHTEEITIDLSDEVFNTPGPVVTPDGFDPEETYYVIDGVADGITNPNIFINARAGIASVKVTTNSQSLMSQGWPAETELCGNASAIASLKALGLDVKGLSGNVGQVAYVNFADVISHINYIEGNSNNADITVEVKDKLGKVSEPVTLKLSAKKITLTLAQASNLRPDGDAMDLTLGYNGVNVKSKVQIQYKNDRGTWSNATIGAVTETADDTYTVSVSGLPTEPETVTLRAKCGAVVSPEISVTRSAIIMVESKDVWATHAIVTPFEGSRSRAGLTFEMSKNGGAFASIEPEQLANGCYKVTGLQPGTEYVIRANDGTSTDEVAITTESAAQLPNADMESWSQTDSGNNWSLIWAGIDDKAAWGTNNPMTTSQGADMAYCRISGTIYTTDAHGGSKAALIRTVGWGSGNTASGSVSTGIMKYSDSGLLHLGASRSVRPSGYKDREGALTTDDLACGIDFASRPASMSFWYKYSPKNSSDHALAEITVLDAGGNLLATGQTTLGSAGSYTQATVALTYADGAAKAAKVYVKFLSTNDRSYLEKNKNNFSAPGFGNSGQSYIGSQLYIDDITLNY